jgi:thiazole tautomerase (transcriptional regulator TenI)
LAQIAAAVTIPVIAIGGILPEFVAEVMASGCAGIAVLSGITAAQDPESAARAYRQALDESGGD